MTARGQFLKILRLGFSFFVLILFVTGCSQPSLFDLLDGPDGIPLQVNPVTAQIINGEILDLQAAGGMPPYSYSLSAGIGGTGEDLSGTVYTAPEDTVGSVLITVQDSYGASSTVNIEVVSSAGDGPLSISPSAVSIYTGNSITLTAQGGTAPYTFNLLEPSLGGTGESLTGSGSSRVYTAPTDVLGDAVIRVSDAVGSVDATVTVLSLGNDIDYAVISEANTGGTIGGGAISGQFQVINNGGDAGTGDVAWSVYTSQAADLGTGDILIDSGTTAALGASTASGLISFTGTWPVPAVDTTWYLIISVSAGDDLPDADNVAVLFETVTAPPVSDVDYLVSRIDSTPASVLAGTSITHTFDIRNDGIDPGTSMFTWTAYVSDDAVPNSGEIVDSGSESALGAGTSMSGISVDGSWPVGSGIYYLIINVSSVEDNNTVNDTAISNSVLVNASGGDIDYVVSDISADYPTVTAGSLVAERFDISNIGGAAGSEVITWTAYASDSSNLDGIYVEIGNGATDTGLGAGSSYLSLPITCNWPVDSDVYYLVMVVGSGDETVTGNNLSSAGPFTVKDPPDYSVSAVNYQSEGEPGTPMSDFGLFDFTISEVSGVNGSIPVSWDVFVSTDNVLDVNDTQVKSGSIPALTGNSDSDAVLFGDVNWPSFGSFYYIIISVAADDDDNGSNDVYVSPTAVTVPELYTETVDSTGSGKSNGEISGVSAPPLDGGDLDRSQLFKVDDLMDYPKTQYDTYQFVLGPDASSVEMYAVWASGTNTIELYLWDEFYGEWSSTAISADREPASGTALFTGLVPGRTYYAGVKFRDNGSGTEGKPYELYVWAE